MNSLSDLYGILKFFLLVIAKIGAIIAVLWLAGLFVSNNWLVSLILIFIAIGIFAALIEEARAERA